MLRVCRADLDLLCGAVRFAVMILAVLHIADDAFNVIFVSAAEAAGLAFALFEIVHFFNSFRGSLLIVFAGAAQDIQKNSASFPSAGFEPLPKRYDLKMAIYAISDLHLAGTAGDAKSMEVFGRRWIGGKKKLTEKWNAIIRPEDDVVIPGDISWAMTLTEALEDFSFIHSLPGRKYIGKGNHDFWWTTASKMNSFFAANGFDSLHLLHNNSYVTPQGVICGTRGWFPDEANQHTVGDVDWLRIVHREAQRLSQSLSSVPPETAGLPVLVFLHFPPVWNGIVCREIVDVLHAFHVRECFYGHIHGVYTSENCFEFEEIRFEMISADYLDFCPHLVAKN